MSIARTLARKVFGRSIEVNDLKIAFHKEANLYGTHGLLLASHVDQALKNVPVRFVFVGLSEAPAMTPTILTYIWEEAKAQGYLPHALAAYGLVLETHTGLSTRDLISAERRAAEDGNYGALPQESTDRAMRAVQQARESSMSRGQQPHAGYLHRHAEQPEASIPFVGPVPNSKNLADRVAKTAAAVESGKMQGTPRATLPETTKGQ